MSTPSEKSQQLWTQKAQRLVRINSTTIRSLASSESTHSCEEKCFLVKHAEESTIQTLTLTAEGREKKKKKVRSIRAWRIIWHLVHTLLCRASACALALMKICSHLQQLLSEVLSGMPSRVENQLQFTGRSEGEALCLTRLHAARAAHSLLWKTVRKTLRRLRINTDTEDMLTWGMTRWRVRSYALPTGKSK